MKSGQRRDGGLGGKEHLVAGARQGTRPGGAGGEGRGAGTGEGRARSRWVGALGSPPLAHLHAWRNGATTAGARSCAGLGGRRSGWGTGHGREVCLAARRWSRRGAGAGGAGRRRRREMLASAGLGWARPGSAGFGGRLGPLGLRLSSSRL